MKTEQLTDFSIDKENKKIKVEREFAAPISKVWAAWTEKELLDQWWAPKPWKAKTKTMDFREGGYWLYVMTGPKGEEQWSRTDYSTITRQKNFSGKDSFCDKDGNIDTSFPTVDWKDTFTGFGDSTTVSIEITFDKPEDIDKYLEMGFKEGFIAGLENLDELLAKQ